MPEGIKIMEQPEIMGTVEIAPHFFIETAGNYPNWWFRMWQRLFLGFKWERNNG